LPGRSIAIPGCAGAGLRHPVLASSKDAAVFIPAFAAGNCTTQVSGVAGSSGLTLVEVSEVSSTPLRTGSD
jgi:hypothetical protein